MYVGCRPTIVCTAFLSFIHRLIYNQGPMTNGTVSSQLDVLDLQSATIQDYIYLRSKKQNSKMDREDLIERLMHGRVMEFFITRVTVS